MNKKKLILLTGLFTIIILISLFLYKLLSLKDNVVFAVAAPITGQDSSIGDAIRKGSRLCADKINQNGGIYGKKIKLEFYDDKNDKRTAMKTAYEIVSDNNALAVLGHYYSSISADTGKVYEKMGIPAITAHSTAESVTAKNNWYFRIVPNNALMAEFIAHYSSKILNKTSACIIFDNDVYGSSLSKNFEKMAVKSGIKILKKWEFSRYDNNIESRIKQIVSELGSIEDAEIIFLATQPIEGAKIAKSLVYPGTEYIIIGGDGFSTLSFRKAIEKYSKEKSDPGYHLNGIYALSPFFINIGNEKTYEFGKEFIQRYGEEPSWVSACAFDAVAVAAEAARQAEIGDSNIRVERRKLRDGLEKYYNSENAYTGVTGRIFFDKNGDAVKFPVIGRYQDNKLLPSYFQYRIIERGNFDKENYLNKNLSGEILEVNETLISKARIVYTGIVLNEIKNLDINNSSYTADFYLWFKYMGKMDFSNLEFIGASKDLVLGKPVKEFNQKDGARVSIFHINGDFSTAFDFHKYPFDIHRLKIQFYNPDMGCDSLIFMPDILDSPDFIIKKDIGTIRFNAVTGWEIKDINIYQDVVSSNYNPYHMILPDSKIEKKWSRFNASIQVKRSYYVIVIRNFLPVLVMIIFLCAIYVIPYNRFSLRIIILIAVLLSNVILQTECFSKLPAEYFTIKDYAIFFVYLLVLISFLWTVFCKFRYSDKNIR